MPQAEDSPSPEDPHNRHKHGAVHPLCGGAPEQKRCIAYSSGALPLGTSESVVAVCRGGCVAQWGGLPRHRCVWIGGHDRPHEGAADPPRRCVWTGVQGASSWRCTRYVAVHPNRRGVMPAVRVRCLLEQVKVWSAVARSGLCGLMGVCVVVPGGGFRQTVDPFTKIPRNLAVFA